MTVYWNVEIIICWNVEMIICWNVENVFWCWLTVSISEVFRRGCICCVRYEDDLIGVLMIDVFFLKILIKWICMKADQRSFGDVKKSFKWMWCQTCCIRPWNNQMHADDCLLTRISCCWLCVKMWCQMTAFDADASDALTKLFDCQNASDVDVIRCTLTIVDFSKNLNLMIVC